jgi:hypothetical protein
MLGLPQPAGTLLGPVQDDKGIALLFTFFKIIITSCNILIALDDVLDWPVVPVLVPVKQIGLTLDMNPVV